MITQSGSIKVALVFPKRVYIQLQIVRYKRKKSISAFKIYFIELYGHFLLALLCSLTDIFRHQMLLGPT